LLRLVEHRNVVVLPKAIQFSAGMSVPVFADHRSLRISALVLKQASRNQHENVCTAEDAGSCLPALNKIVYDFFRRIGNILPGLAWMIFPVT
jgi:hypothetical protein